MNERDVQLAVMEFIRESVMCAAPNYTPFGWWECDLWSVSRAGYATEYEIKLTAADLRADSRKTQFRCNLAGGAGLLDSRDVRKLETIPSDAAAPSRFYYVVPTELRGERFPEFAGVMIFDGASIEVARPAPLLGRRRIHPREIVICQRRMWNRYWESLRTIQRQARDLQDLSSRVGPVPPPIASGDDAPQLS